MTITSSYIQLNGVRFHACHGVLPQEQTVGADFVLTLRVGYPLRRAMLTDDVADTLDYSRLYELARREMATPSRLLEHVAGRICDAIVDAMPQVLSIDLTLLKVNPPMGADCSGAGVEIHLINDKTQ